MSGGHFRTILPLRATLYHCQRKSVPCLLRVTRPRLLCNISGTLSYSSGKADSSSEPVKFTTSSANMLTLPKPKDVNKYQGIIVTISFFVFTVYFCYLREENDLDDLLRTSLFDQVPSLEEPHLVQAIKLMKEKGLDTSEAEARLKDLVEKRLAEEQEQNKRS